jgi:hypothetical protein
MASLLYGKFQLFHRNFSLMEKLQNETAMYTRLVYIDTVGHDADKRHKQTPVNHHFRSIPVSLQGSTWTTLRLGIVLVV